MTPPDLAALAAGARPAGGSLGIDVVAALQQLAQQWPQPLTAADGAVLDTICRKLALTRTVLAQYDEGWKRPATPRPLDIDGWSLLVGVVLAYAEPTAIDDRGTALKRVNGGFMALDAAGRAGLPQGAALQAYAHDLLVRLTGR